MAIEVVIRSVEEVAGELYSETSKAIEQGEHGIEMLALHIPYALGNNPEGYIAWRKRVLPPDGKVVELTRFEDYLLKPVREGFGLPSLYFLDGAMKLLGKKGQPALAALRQEIPDWDERVEREGRKQRVKEAPELADHRRPTKEEQDKGRDSTFNGKRDNDYLTARIKRDAPEIAVRLEQGEFKSVRAAAIEAGIVKPPSNMEAIRRLWGKLSRDERMDFWRWAHEQ